MKSNRKCDAPGCKFAPAAFPAGVDRLPKMRRSDTPEGVQGGEEQDSHRSWCGLSGQSSSARSAERKLLGSLASLPRVSPLSLREDILTVLSPLGMPD